jgi:hypothetical protein
VTLLIKWFEQKLEMVVVWFVGVDLGWNYDFGHP